MVLNVPRLIENVVVPQIMRGLPRLLGSTGPNLPIACPMVVRMEKDGGELLISEPRSLDRFAGSNSLQDSSPLDNPWLRLDAAAACHSKWSHT